MAKMNGVTGTFTGKLGSLVVAYRRGKYIGRQYVPNPYNPKTGKQTMQRRMFASCTETMRYFLKFIRTGYRAFRPTYQFQEAVKANVPNFVLSNPVEDVEVSFADLKLSHDDFPEQATASAQAGDTNQIAVSGTAPNFDTIPADYDISRASFQIAAFSPELQEIVGAVISGIEAGQAFNATINVPVHWNGALCHVYGFLVVPPARSINGAGNGIPPICSATGYLGSVTIE